MKPEFTGGLQSENYIKINLLEISTCFHYIIIISLVLSISYCSCFLDNKIFIYVAVYLSNYVYLSSLSGCIFFL